MAHEHLTKPTVTRRGRGAAVKVVGRVRGCGGSDGVKRVACPSLPSLPLPPHPRPLVKTKHPHGGLVHEGPPSGQKACTPGNSKL
ncbi:hypothetical protein E2C01_021292 [Portunus trituberculatus]|uniref:Uncharacterized protein n=1 Tax=Portunus trituberculatus TaxID=210409 RepID=A0A5B7E422_PORTR|nr:hypothetical protein [Portunus trituberculatus]